MKLGHTLLCQLRGCEHRMVKGERVEVTVICMVELTMINVLVIERAEGVVRKTINSNITAKTICP